jgi:hypothetical protein
MIDIVHHQKPATQDEELLGSQARPGDTASPRVPWLGEDGYESINHLRLHLPPTVECHFMARSRRVVVRHLENLKYPEESQHYDLAAALKSSSKGRLLFLTLSLRLATVQHWQRCKTMVGR